MNPLPHPIALADANRYMLEQTEAFVRILADSAYKKTAPKTYRSAIGSHLRHILDHYDSFFAMTEQKNEAIDYDARSRDKSTENCRETGLTRLVTLQKKLTQFCERPLSEKTNVLCYDNGLSGVKINTSIERELMFLMSHTVHHLALIAIIARLENYPIEEDFGIAPSTLRYKASQNQCAVAT